MSTLGLIFPQERNSTSKSWKVHKYPFKLQQTLLPTRQPKRYLLSAATASTSSSLGPFSHNCRWPRNVTQRLQRPAGACVHGMMKGSTRSDRMACMSLSAWSQDRLEDVRGRLWAVENSRSGDHISEDCKHE